MKRILSLYIIREITSLFLLGISIFTLILLMGRLIKLTELVVSRGVPPGDVGRMIMYLMPVLSGFYDTNGLSAGCFAGFRPAFR